MTKGFRVLRTVSASLAVLLIVATVLSFFIVPRISDRKMREMLGDENAYVTDTARDPWIYVTEDGVAKLNAEHCLGMEEIIIPDAVNGIAVTSYDLDFKKPPAWVKRVVFPKTMQTIAEFPFHQWTGIEEIIFSEGITEFSRMHLGEKENLKKLVLPRSIDGLRYDVIKEAHPDLVIYYGGTEEEWLALGAGAKELSKKYTVVFESNGEEFQN